MSKTSVNQVIQRAVSDAAFRRQLQREPGKALAGFDLTAEERASITSGDPARLTALGVDQRMSKAFVLGAAADASTAVQSGITGNLGASGSAAFIDESGSGASRGLIGDSTSGATSVFASDPTSGATAGIVGDSTTGASGTIVGSDGPQLDPGIVSDPASGATAVIPGDPTTGATADLSTAGDGNTIDPGLVDTSATQFAGTQVTIVDQPQTAFENAGDATVGVDPSLSNTLQDGGVAPTIDPTPTFDGHVTIDDGGDSLTQ